MKPIKVVHKSSKKEDTPSKSTKENAKQPTYDKKRLRKKEEDNV